MRLKYSKLYPGDHNTDTHSLGGMFLSNMGTPRASAMPSFNTIKGLEAFKAFGRFVSTSGGTEEVESEMQCLIYKTLVNNNNNDNHNDDNDNDDDNDGGGGGGGDGGDDGGGRGGRDGDDDDDDDDDDDEKIFSTSEK